MAIEIYSHLASLQRQQPIAPAARTQDVAATQLRVEEKQTTPATPQLARAEHLWLAEGLGQVQVTREALQQIEEALQQAKQLIQQESHTTDEQKAASQAQLDKVALFIADTIQQAQLNGEPLLNDKALGKVIPESLVAESASESSTSYLKLGLPGGLAAAVLLDDQQANNQQVINQQANGPSVAEFRLNNQADIFTGEIKEWPDSPYFSSSAYQAVQAFRTTLAEMFQAPLAAEPDQITIGSELGAVARELVAEQATEQNLGQWRQAAVDFQGHSLRVEGQVELNSQQQVQFDENAAMVIEVNGTQLTMEGPFIRFLGPVDEETFSLPKDEQGKPYVAVQPHLLQALSHAEADPRQWMRLEDAGLASSLAEALSGLQQLTPKLDTQIEALARPTDGKPLENHQQALAVLQQTQSLMEQQQQAAVAAQGQLSTEALLTLVEPGK